MLRQVISEEQKQNRAQDRALHDAMCDRQRRARPSPDRLTATGETRTEPSLVYSVPPQLPQKTAMLDTIKRLGGVRRNQ